jgi:hypothetical protein
MVLVNIDDTLADEAKKIVDEDKIEFPNFKNFVDKAIKRFIEVERLRIEEHKK